MPARHLTISDARPLMSQSPKSAPVAVLYCRLRGYERLSRELELNTLLDFMQRYLDQVLRACAAHGGAVQRTTREGVMAVFKGSGSPSARAVAAALEMQTRVHACLAASSAALRNPFTFAGVGLGVGVATEWPSHGWKARLGLGRQSVGSLAEEAARLEQAAPRGAVLVDETTREATGARFDFTRPTGQGGAAAAYVRVARAEGEVANIGGVDEVPPWLAGFASVWS